MRPSNKTAKTTPAHWLPFHRIGKRVAQAPDQPPAPPPPDQPPANPPPDQTPPANPPPQPEQTPPANPPPANPPANPEQQPNVGQTPNLSDEELAKLAEQETQGEEIISVTGSLIGRKEIDTPSPISMVDKEKIESAGITNVGDVLQRIPAQGNAINAQNNNGGDGSTRIDLRSLGSNRTLILMNGRRVVPSGLGADSSVDLGTIPIAMIERVEVLKDGASAIYGSDAISGVVNVITRTDFNGTEATAYTATSQKGDGTNYDLSLVTGHSSKKGNLTFAAGYQDQKAVMAGDRSFAAKTFGYNFCNDQQLADDMMNPPDMRTCNTKVLVGSSASPTGRLSVSNGGDPLTVPGCTAKNCTSDGKGGWRNFIPPTETEFGDNYNFQPLNYLFTPSKRVNLFANGHYDITKNVHTFFEAMYNNRKSEQQLAEEPLFLAQTGTPISADSIYNPFGKDVVNYNRRLVEFGTRNFNQDISTNRVVAGLDGGVPEDFEALKSWKWEASFNYGRTDATQSTHGDLILSHLANALGPSFVDPVLGPQCGTPAAPIGGGCVPLNLLTSPGRPGTVDPAAIAYLTFTGINSGFNEQRTTLLQAHGKIVDLPNHGDISLAVGGDYRHEQGGFQPDPLTSTGDTTGNAVQPTEGAYHAFEGFGELSIVPVSGLDSIKWAELDLAGRAYSYNVFENGSGATWKASALVRTVGNIAVRGTYGTAFRAPNIGELFSGQADSFPLLEDPCDITPPSAGGDTVPLTGNTAAECKKEGVVQPDGTPGASFSTQQQRSKVGGNKALHPETANIATAGIVLEPIKGLDFTLDYWNVHIDDAIATLPPQTILTQCYEGGIQSFCQQIQREPVTHSIDHIIDLIQNVGSVETSGLDFSAAYAYKVPDVGSFRHALEGTWLFKYNVDTGTVDPNTMKEQILHGKGFYDLGVLPALKFNVFTTWSHPSGFGAGFNIRYVGGFKECDSNNCNDPTAGRRSVDSYATGDLFLDYQVKTAGGTTRVAVGMNNAIDATPPVIFNGAALNADESAYDFMGRYFYIRLGQLF